MVEHQLPKLRVAGSSPVSRSIKKIEGRLLTLDFFRAVSSVGLERLPYKQEVTGSNPVPPTHILLKVLFYLHLKRYR